MSRWPELYDFEVDSTPLPKLECFPRGEAARKARRAFAYAAVIFGALGFAAGAAWSETITIGSIYVNGQNQQGTTVTITPSNEPGEWARVVMLNRYVNQGKDDGDYTLPFDGVTIGVAFVWDAVPVLGSDQITLTVPDGIVCVPTDCSIAVGEGLSGEIVLLDWRGM